MQARSGLSSHLMPTPLRSPHSLGFSMPAEWEEHEATWLAWPHNPTDWPDKLDIVRGVYGETVRKIAPGEIVRMVVDSRKDEKLARAYLKRAGAATGRVEFVVHPTNRGWTRDSGPIFVRRRSAKKTETAIVDFHFNAWAKYPDWRKDRRLPATAAKYLGQRLFDARRKGKEFVLEGGGIDVNGLGTLITTVECYLDPVVQVRNPGVGRHEFEAILKAYLGAGNVLWLAGGVTGDDTHGHVDDICRFVNRSTVVLIREDNAADSNYRPLAENWERVEDFRLEDGSKPEVVALPMPAPLYFEGERLPASYANFYISNSAVIVPTFNDPNDRVALGILDRKSTRLNSSHANISYALFCLKKKNKPEPHLAALRPRAASHGIAPHRHAV